MVPEPDTVDWIFDASHWWLESFGGFEHFAASTLLSSPTVEDFPVDLGLTGDALAQDYFAFVKEHTGLGEWPFLLAADRAPDVAAALRGMPHAMTSAPTSSEAPGLLEEGEPLTIPYDPAQLEDPVDLVATMARGVSHYLLPTAATELPGDADEREYFVDLGAVLLGFGVFLANSAFAFQQSSEGMMAGWGFRRRGALSELDVSYSLALVATLLDTADGDIVPHLATNPRGFFKAAKKDIRSKRRADVERLRAVPSPGGGPYR